jgi:hypothetical protein
LHFPDDDIHAHENGVDPSASFLATLDRMHLTAVAGAEALSETRRRDALVQGLRLVRRVMARDDPSDRAKLAEAQNVPPDLKSHCERLGEQQMRLVERLDEVAECLVYGDSLADIVPQVVDLVAAIRTHEFDERDLIQRATELDAAGRD